MKIFLSILAVIVGFLAGGFCVAIVEWMSSLLHPMPAGLTMDDAEGMREWVKTLPTSAFIFLLVAWSAGCFSGAFVARSIAPGRSVIPALIVWALLSAATIFNLVTLPHPIWLWPAAIAGCLIFGLLGLVLAAPKAYIVQTTRSIRAPAEKVFKTIASIDNFSKAIPGITKVEFLSDQQYGVGTRFRETRIMHGKEASTVLEVTKLDENKLIRMVSDAGGAIWDTVFTVEQRDNDTTEMHMKMDAIPRAIAAKIVLPMILGMVGKAVESDMDSVKSYCEEG